MKKNYISIYFLAALLGAGVIITSCNKEEVISQPEKKPETSDIIRFGINMFNNWLPDNIGEDAPESATKSEGATYSESLPMDCLEGEGPATEIHMYMIEEELPPVIDTVDTKADATTPEYVYGLYAFQMQTSAVNSSSPKYAGTSAQAFNGMSNLGLTEDGQTYYGGDKYWPGDAWWLKFFIYSPYHSASDANLTLSTVANNDPTPKFSYTVPTTVAEQHDLMSGTSSLIQGSVTNEVAINMEHILSQIQVKAGTLDEGKIMSIAFRNIYDKGERIMITPDGNGSAWTLLPATAGATDLSIADYTKSFGEQGKDISTITSSNNELVEPMHLLPQTLSDAATIEVVMKVESTDPTSNATRKNTYTLTKNLKAFVAEWEPNKKYTYVISTPEEVEVEVTDVVDNTGTYPVKRDLQIKNTGLSTVYVRASVVGNWVMPNATPEFEDDMIVAEWQTVTDATKGKVPDGEFVYNGGTHASKLPESTIGDWIYINGYYYYTQPLESGQVAPKLFESYTLKANPPMAKAVFDLTIVAQAVYHTDVALVWPVTKGADGVLSKVTNP